MQNDNTIGTKVPPHSFEAEKSVLGSMILSLKAIQEIEEIITEHDFFNINHAKIFKTMIEMYDDNISIDLVTLSERLRESGVLEDIGGIGALVEINKETPTAANVIQHAHIVKERSLKRKMMYLGQKMYYESVDDTNDVYDLLDKLNADVEKLTVFNVPSGFKTIDEIAAPTFNYLEKIRKEGVAGLATGFEKYDQLTGGLLPSDLIIVAGRPGSGKTAFALSMARNIIKKNIPIAFISIEMASLQLMVRMLSTETGVNQFAIRTGITTDDDMNKIQVALSALAGTKCYIDDSPIQNINTLRSKCRRLKKENDIQVIFVDYLQLIKAKGKRSETEEISYVSETLKVIAKELNIPVVALAQLNRENTKRGNQSPRVSDLRGSGGIEQDADVVVLIDRPETYGKTLFDDDKLPTDGMAEIIIGKQRNGATGKHRLKFNKSTVAFENFNDYYEAPDWHNEPAETDAF